MSRLWRPSVNSTETPAAREASRGDRGSARSIKAVARLRFGRVSPIPLHTRPQGFPKKSLLAWGSTRAVSDKMQAAWPPIFSPQIPAPNAPSTALRPLHTNAMTHPTPFPTPASAAAGPQPRSGPWISPGTPHTPRSLARRDGLIGAPTGRRLCQRGPSCFRATEERRQRERLIATCVCRGRVASIESVPIGSHSIRC